MRVYTKTIKVLGLGKDELDALQDMVAEARSKGKAERQVAPNAYLAIEVGDFAYHPPIRDARK